MSAELLRPTATESSRIPVASPSCGFRRSASMRLRGERPVTLRIRGAGAAPAVSPTDGFRDLQDQRHSQRAPAAARPPSRHPHDNPSTVAHHLEANTGHRVRSYSLNLSSSRLNARAVADVELEAAPAVHRQRTPDDDLDSLRSYASGASTASCEHPFVAHNGTTFSGRRMRYVVHCSAHAGQSGEDYLTPTQRAQRQVRRLKQLLGQAKQDIEQKDSDIFRLTKEVVELRLYKACARPGQADHSPESSSEAVTVRENADPDATDADMKMTPDSPTCTELTDELARSGAELDGGKDMHSSYADSGHFEDLERGPERADKACLARLEFTEERKLIELYERRLEDAVRAHADQTHELQQRHHDKIEELLHKLSDVNIRYCQLVPDYEQARERIQELERQLDEVTARLQAVSGEQQEAAAADQATALVAHAPSRVSVSQLLQQLQITQTELDNIKDTEFTAEQSLLSAKEAVSLWVLGARKAMYRRLVESRSARHAMDPEITLQFLKSAIYYFLTDRENHQGHLKAIQSILGFTPQEIANIDRARASYYH